MEVEGFMSHLASQMGCNHCLFYSFMERTALPKKFPVFVRHCSAGRLHLRSLLRNCRWKWWAHPMRLTYLFPASIHWRLLILMAALCCISCSKSGFYNPVHGKVLYQNEPIEGVVVTF